MALASGYHHLTLSTDGAQKDFDFYTKTLGLHSVKRTVLFDGVVPVYHLYYGSPNGDASTIITTFPFRKPGIYGRLGTNQARTIMQAIPKGAADFWVDRLNGRGIQGSKITRFGADRVAGASRPRKCNPMCWRGWVRRGSPSCCPVRQAPAGMPRKPLIR